MALMAAAEGIPRLRAATVALALLGRLCTALAQGGPPMITDDPGTPGPGNWEINVATLGLRSASSTVGESPLVDINFGVGEQIQLKYEMPWVTQRDADGSTRSGLGNSLLGVKWRFHDAGLEGWSASIYPQVELRNPASHSPRRGLADDGTGVLLPIEIEREFRRIGVNLEVGRELHSRDENGWFGGIVLGRELGRSVEILAEIHGEAAGSQHSQLAMNFGARLRLRPFGTLLVSLGRDLHDTLEAPAQIFGYVGWCLNIAPGPE